METTQDTTTTQAQPQDKRVASKIDSKLAKVLAAAVAKESTRYCITAVNVEDRRLVATDGRFLVVIHLNHVIPFGLYKLEGATLWPSDEEGNFPQWADCFPKAEDLAEAKYPIGTNPRGEPNFWPHLISSLLEIRRTVDVAGEARATLGAIERLRPGAFTVSFGKKKDAPILFEFLDCTACEYVQFLAMPYQAMEPEWRCTPAWLLEERGDEIQGDGDGMDNGVTNAA